MGGRDELAGSDVILVHRLLKNTVKDRFGDRAYALFSDRCVRAMGIDPAVQGFIGHQETIDIIGAVSCWVRDLEGAWNDEKDRRRNLVTRSMSAQVIEFDIAAPRAKVWQYFTQPGQRPKWRAADEVRETSAGGRRGVGTTNHCMHGPHAIIEEVLDWRPFDYLTLTTLLPVPDAPKVLMTYAFTENADGGAHIEIRLARPKPEDRTFLEHVGAEFKKTITGEIAALRPMLEQEEETSGIIETPAQRAAAKRVLPSVAALQEDADRPPIAENCAGTRRAQAAGGSD